MEINTLMQNLTKRGYTPYHFATVSQANDFLLTLIPPQSSIGFGGSVTVKDMELPELFRDRGNDVFYRGFPATDQEKDALFAKIHTADWFISSTNALTVKGDLINIDGRANRVAEMLYGPKNVVIVAGINKITNTIEDGIARVRNVAAPQNCVKLKKDTPCATNGTCSYCDYPHTICRATVIQHHPTFGQNVFIIIVNQNLGF